MASSVKLVILGTLPGCNEYINAQRRDRQLGARLKRETEERILWAIQQQLRGMRFDVPVVMHYLWVEKNRKRDKDNIAFARKFVQDALVKAGVLRNDGWGEIVGFSDAFAVDGKRARVEVDILEEKVVTNNG